MKELEGMHEEVCKEATEKSAKMTVELHELEDRIEVEEKGTPGSHRDLQLKVLADNEKEEKVQLAVLQTKVEAIAKQDAELAKV